MSDIDFDGAADVAAAIEAAGGSIEDFDTGLKQRTPQGPMDIAAALGGPVRTYRFDVVIPGDTERDFTLDDVRQQAVQDALADILDAADGMPVDPDMTPAQNLRAVVGQTSIDLSTFRAAYLDVHDDPPTGWDIGPPADAHDLDDQDSVDIDVD